MDPKRCEKGAQNHREAIRNEAKKGAKPTDAAQRREKTKRYAERLQRDAAKMVATAGRIQKGEGGAAVRRPWGVFNNGGVR